MAFRGSLRAAAPYCRSVVRRNGNSHARPAPRPISPEDPLSVHPLRPDRGLLMSFPLDALLDHLKEQADIFGALLEQETGQTATLLTDEISRPERTPDVRDYAACLWIVAESVTLGLALPAEFVPIEWDGLTHAPADLADRLAAVLIPETMRYKDPRLAGINDLIIATVGDTTAVELPVEEIESPPVLFVGLHNPSAVDRVGDGRLLNLPVDVVVTLAEKRIDVGQLLAISPGSMIAFDKPCEELLDLYVNNHLHARGEAVKIGEKFGLKISRIGVEEQRVSPVLPPSRG